LQMCNHFKDNLQTKIMPDYKCKSVPLTRNRIADVWCLAITFLAQKSIKRSSCGGFVTLNLVWPISSFLSQIGALWKLFIFYGCCKDAKAVYIFFIRCKNGLNSIFRKGKSFRQKLILSSLLILRCTLF